MPIIRPFKALRYNKSKVRDLARVVAPPYDVISSSRQEELYLSHPNNIIRLILGRIEKSDTKDDNRYTRAGGFLSTWLNDGILMQDASPAIYVYSQEYIYNGKRIERRGFLALMSLGLDCDNRVLPHENTLAAPKEDRFKLMKEVRANLSPIFVLYDDPKHALLNMLRAHLKKTKPVIDIKFEKVRNRVWCIDDKEMIGRAEKFMKDRDIFIAYGHHRYETARNYAKAISSENIPAGVRENAGYMMVYFVESDERALTVLPAHRLIKDISGLGKEEILARLEKFFAVKKVKGLKALLAALDRKRSLHAFGVYFGRGDFRLMVLKDPRDSDKVIKDKPKDWKRLDVSILHNLIIQHILQASDSDDNVDFVKDPAETALMMDRGGYGIAFFLNPTKASQVKRIAKICERMPRKATYFYPKPVSGITIHKF